MSVTGPPRQIPFTGALLVAEVGSVEGVLTVTVTDWQSVVLQSPSARTKYVVVEVGFTLIVAPIPASVPPQLPEYHFHCALVPREPPFTESCDGSPAQSVITDADADVAATEGAFTVMTMLAQFVVLQIPSART